MGGSSSSSSSQSNQTNDNRVIATDGAQGVSGGGDVSVHIVADEAFELGEAAIDSGEAQSLAVLDFAAGAVDRLEGGYTKALDSTQTALERVTSSEGKTLSGDIIKIGIPAAALAYVAAQWAK